jgi:hypothetical protein
MMVLPRLALLFVAVFHTQHVKYAFASMIWPCLGFFIMPITTLAYIWAMAASQKNINGFYLAIVVLAVLLDLGLLTGAGKTNYRSAPPAEF